MKKRNKNRYFVNLTIVLYYLNAQLIIKTDDYYGGQ